MLNLLNAVKMNDALFWMLVVLGIFLIVEIAAFAIIMLSKRRKTPEEKTRQAVSITLDTQIVRREFKVGESFDPSGLIVTAHFNDEPYEETVQEFTVVTPELIKKLARDGKTPEDIMGCRIYAPDLSVEGKPSVKVAYLNQTAAYAISVGEITKAESAPATSAAGIAAYTVNVVAPEELNGLQVALYNGNKQVGDAVNVENGKAVLVAPTDEYIIRVFGLPDDDFEVSGGVLSATKLSATVTIDYCEDYYDQVKEEAVEPEAEAAEELNLVKYEIAVTAPEEIKSIQVALYNGNVQIGDAVNVESRKATILAPAGEYIIKVFGLPDSDYVVDAELLSAEKLTANVIIDFCEDYYTVEEKEEEPEAEEIVPTVSEIIEVEPEVELVDYNVIVNAPEGLTALQVALYNGDKQVGDAANVESGAATLSAEEGEYAVRIFGVPEGYEVSEGTVSATRHICTLTITEPVKEDEIAVAEDTAVAERTEPVVIVEESFEGGILRYNKSFTARLIQSDNEVKQWYTELKNELLSYKKVHDRMSWKRESYNFGRLPFARLAYRGETLCIYLPLDPESFAESKYKVESVADNATFADTPCLYRIKNNKRAKYAKELIAMVAESLGATQFERESQDYYLPYEGIVELINKGLIKRNIKSSSEEAFFVANKNEN